MRTSEQVDFIFSAMSKAQAKIKTAEKNSINPHFKSKFANEESVHDAAQLALAENDLTVIQGAEFKHEQWVMVIRIGHKSGQWVESEYPIIATQMTAQGFGSASTYARRYNYLGMVGVVAGDDDDGNEAVKKGEIKNENTKSKQNAGIIGLPGNMPDFDGYDSESDFRQSHASRPNGSSSNANVGVSSDSKISDIGAQKFPPGFGIYEKKSFNEAYQEEIKTGFKWSRHLVKNINNIPPVYKDFLNYADSLGAPLE